MADDIKARIEKALDEQDSTDFNTPSGATLTLMSELLDEDNLQGFSCVYLAYSHRHASNAGFIKNRMPAKIRNFLITHRAIDPTSLTEWTNNNPDWEDALKDALPNPPAFEARVERIARVIKDSKK